MLNHFHLYVYPRRQVQIGERFHKALAGVKDIDDPFMNPEFELFPAVLVDERRPVDGIFLEFRRQRNGSDNIGVGTLQHFHYLTARIIYEPLIV